MGLFQFDCWFHIKLLVKLVHLNTQINKNMVIYKSLDLKTKMFFFFDYTNHLNQEIKIKQKNKITNCRISDELLKYTKLIT